jgi:hypothetical protein
LYPPEVPGEHLLDRIGDEQPLSPEDQLHIMHVQQVWEPSGRTTVSELHDLCSYHDYYWRPWQGCTSLQNLSSGMHCQMIISDRLPAITVSPHCQFATAKYPP